MAMEKEMETETETETTIYNLRSRMVTRCSLVSKAQREEEAAARAKKPGKKRAGGPGWAVNRGPPPLTGRRLQNYLKRMNRVLREHATRALYSYNRGRQELQLPRYKIVETLKMKACALKCGIVHHLNFKARPKDDPSAPPELFFAERVIGWDGSKQTRCYNMGTGSPQPATVGRKACTICEQIYHPKGKEFLGSIVG